MKEQLRLDIATAKKQLRHILIDLESTQDIIKNTYLSEALRALIDTITSLGNVRID